MGRLPREAQRFAKPRQVDPFVLGQARFRLLEFLEQHIELRPGPRLACSRARRESAERRDVVVQPLLDVLFAESTEFSQHLGRVWFGRPRPAGVA